MDARPLRLEDPRRTAPPRRAPLWHRSIAFVLKAALPVVVVAAALYAAQQIYLTAPVAERAERPRIARLVETAVVRAETQGPTIEVWGEVVASRRLMLRPEIGGRITAISPDLVPGGTVAAGTELLRIDDSGLALQIATAEAEAAQIRAQILMERGQASRAASDLDRGRPLRLTDEQRALVLRKPQMQELEARLAAAEARIADAALQREKAVLRAPFDAVVTSEQVAEGAVAMAGTELAQLVAADRFEVHLAVPPGALDWIDIEGGAEVRLSDPGLWGPDRTRAARIDRLGAELSETGRMARLILSVDDPLARGAAKGAPRLLLGSFLRAEIAGREIPDAIALERAWLRDGDTVWVMTPEKRLEVRTVTVAWRGTDRVLVSGGLSDGERVVTTHLATHADGMALRAAGERREARP